MSDTKFTPGNWNWNEDKWNGGWSGLYSDGDTPVLVPQSCNDADDGAAWFATVDDAGEEGLTDADRALIAAAPKLYRALDEAVKDLVAYQVNARIASKYNSKWEGVSELVQPTIDSARAALAESRGEKS